LLRCPRQIKDDVVVAVVVVVVVVGSDCDQNEIGRYLVLGT